MPREVAWRLMFRVNDQRAADRCLSKVLGKITATVTDGPKPYWKRPELWEVSFRSVLASPPNEGILSLLTSADLFGTGWNVSGPAISGGQISFFDGIFDSSWGRPHMPGLEWASFSVGDFPKIGCE